MTAPQRLNQLLRPVPAWPLYIIGAAYAGWLFYLGLTGGLGVEPINALERAYGEVGFQLLLVTLLITPLRDWVGVNLIKYRRALGVLTFFFILAHFTVWALLDVQSLERVWADIIKRPYVTVGMAAFLLMVPLALTSNNLSIRKLGPLAWRKLHKLTYPVAALASLHWLWLMKGFQIEPVLYAAATFGLLAYRFWPKAQNRAVSRA